MPLEDNNNFDAAFDQFSVPEDKKADDKPAEAAPVDSAAEAPANDQVLDDAAAVAQAAEDAKAAEAKPEGEVAAEAKPEDVPTDQAAIDAAKAAEAKPEDKPADTSAQDDVLAKLAKVVADASKEAKPEDKAADVADEAPLYTTEEQELIEAHNKEWGDLTKAEELKRRGEYRELLQFVFAEVAKAMQPIREVTDLLGDRAHLTDVKTVVPDYNDDLRDQVISWVDTQPAYLQSAYKQVIQAGTVEEVKDLVDRYRGANGLKADDVSAAPKPTGKKDTELSSEVKQAASALAPVESKRSGVQQPGDPADFEDAWKQFAKDASI